MYVTLHNFSRIPTYANNFISKGTSLILSVNLFYRILYVIVYNCKVYITTIGLRNGITHMHLTDKPVMKAKRTCNSIQIQLKNERANHLSMQGQNNRIPNTDLQLLCDVTSIFRDCIPWLSNFQRRGAVVDTNKWQFTRGWGQSKGIKCDVLKDLRYYCINPLKFAFE